MNGKLFYGALIALGLMMSACVISPKQGTTSDNIHTMLQKDVAADEAIAQKKRVAVNTALLQSQSPISMAPYIIKERHFNVTVNNAPARSFFMGLVAGTPYNMIVSPDISGTISVKLKNVTIPQVLEAVQDLYGYDYQRTPYGFAVLPPTLKTRIFSVNYLDVARKAQSNVSLTTSELTSTVGATSAGGGTSNNSSGSGSANGLTPGSGAKVVTTSETDFWHNLEITLNTMIGAGQGRTVTINPQAGIVVIHAFPKQIREVGAYLADIQNSLNRQVVLEAKILEVQLNDDYQAGINWKILNLSQGGGTLIPNPIDVGNQFLTFQAGNRFRTVISLLEQQGNVQVLSSPRISTVNNQQAVIKVGEDEFFVTSITSNQTPSNGSTSTSQSVGLTPFFSGITLDVTPQISAKGEIILHVHPAVSTVVQQTKVVDLGSSGGTDQKLTLPLAQSTVRESDSIVRALSGQVVVIGGLMQNNMSENNDQIPAASHIPFFGALFRNTKQSSHKSELVILLRPVLVDNHTWGNELTDDSQQFYRLNKGFHIGARPDVFGTRGEVNQ